MDWFDLMFDNISEDLSRRYNAYYILVSCLSKIKLLKLNKIMKYIILEEPKLEKRRKFKTILLIDDKGEFCFSSIIIKSNTAEEIIKGLQQILDKEKNGKNI